MEEFGHKVVQKDFDCPSIFARSWLAFCRLSARREGGLSGAEPIPWSEIGWYCVLNHEKLASYEIEAIEGLDNIYLEIVSKKRNKKGKK